MTVVPNQIYLKWAVKSILEENPPSQRMTVAKASSCGVPYGVEGNVWLSELFLESVIETYYKLSV